MVRKKRKRIQDKKWIPVYFDNCPKCHGVAEIYTFSIKDDLFFDQDDVRCANQCGTKGQFKITTGHFSGRIDWNYSTLNEF